MKKWSVLVAKLIENQFEGEFHPKMGNKWGYVSGMTLKAFALLGEHVNEQRYIDLSNKHLDLFVQEDGTVKGYHVEEYNLDHINQGKLLFARWKDTNEIKYKQAIYQLYSQLCGQPRTLTGGFWHKKIYPFQMWLDGIYMSSPFLAEFAKTFDHYDEFDVVAHQILLIEQQTRNPDTGLLHHAWDESKEQRWCYRDTGRSPHVWGRGMGWYMMAIVDALEHFPVDHPKRGQIMGIFERLSQAVLDVQDEQTGVWYQLMDQNGRKDNYLESSGSCMITYALIKGLRLKYLSWIDRKRVKKAYEGIIEQFVTEDEQGAHLHHICFGAGLGGKKYRDGSYEYYMKEEVGSDALMGVAPFLLASIEFEKYFNQ